MRKNKRLATKIQHILLQHEQLACEYIRSEQYCLAGRNYAYDMLEAVDYARSLLNGHRGDQQKMIARFKQGMQRFKEYYDDPESFGYGTLVDILGSLEQL